jgi:hypothetical protein
MPRPFDDQCRTSLDSVVPSAADVNESDLVCFDLLGGPRPGSIRALKLKPAA